MKVTWKKYKYLEIDELQAFYFDGDGDKMLELTSEFPGLSFQYDPIQNNVAVGGFSINGDQQITFIKGYICFYLNSLYLCYLHDFELYAKELDNDSIEIKRDFTDQEIKKSIEIARDYDEIVSKLVRLETKVYMQEVEIEKADRTLEIKINILFYSFFIVSLIIFYIFTKL